MFDYERPRSDRRVYASEKVPRIWPDSPDEFITAGVWVVLVVAAKHLGVIDKQWFVMELLYFITLLVVGIFALPVGKYCYYWLDAPRVLRKRGEAETAAELERLRELAEARIGSEPQPDRTSHLISDELTKLRAEGLHSIRNEFEHNPQNLAIYLSREKEWSARVKAAMERLGCTAWEISRVMDVTYSEIGKGAAGANYGPDGNWLLGLMEMRLARLADVIAECKAPAGNTETPRPGAGSSLARSGGPSVNPHEYSDSAISKPTSRDWEKLSTHFRKYDGELEAFWEFYRRSGETEWNIPKRSDSGRRIQEFIADAKKAGSMAKAIGPHRTKFNVSDETSPEDYWLMILLTNVDPMNDISTAGNDPAKGESIGGVIKDVINASAVACKQFATESAVNTPRAAKSGVGQVLPGREYQAAYGQHLIEQATPLKASLSLVDNPGGSAGLKIVATNSAVVAVEKARVIISDVLLFDEKDRAWMTTNDIHGSETTITAIELGSATLHPKAQVQLSFIHDDGFRLSIGETGLRLKTAGTWQIRYRIIADERSVDGAVCFWWSGPDQKGIRIVPAVCPA